MKRLVSIAFALLLLGCAPHRHYVADRQVNTHLYKFDSASVKNEKMEHFLSPYRTEMEQAMDEVVGTTDVPLTKAQPECTLGNFMADAQLLKAQSIDPKVVGSVVNYGGIRIPYVATGNITRGRVFEIMPFDNKLTLLSISGETLQTFCDLMASRGGWPVSGITYTIVQGKAVNVKVGGQSVNPHIIYKIALSDYLANGGDDCSFLAAGKRTDVNIFVRDLLIEYLLGLKEKGESLHPALENRVSDGE